MGVDKEMLELAKQKYKVDRMPQELGFDMTLGAGKKVNNHEIISIFKEPSYAEHVPEGGIVEQQVDQDQGIDTGEGEPGAGQEGVNQGCDEVQGPERGYIGGVGQQPVPGRRAILAGKRRIKVTTVSKNQSTILTYFSLHSATLGINGELSTKKCNVGGPKRNKCDVQLEGPAISCKRTCKELDQVTEILTQ